MNPILYFVKGRPTKEQVESTFKNHPKFQRMENSIGVNSIGQGTMLNDSRGFNPMLDQENQVWHEAADGSFWFGWNKNKKPGPSDLQKPEIIDGDSYKGWVIPKVRNWQIVNGQATNWTSLPKDAVWDGEKFRPGEVSAPYRQVAELGEEAWMILMELHSQQQKEGKMTLPSNCMELVYQIVSINYYMGRDEFAALGVVPFEFWEMVEVFRVFTGFNDAIKLLEEQQKKTDQAFE